MLQRLNPHQPKPMRAEIASLFLEFPRVPVRLALIGQPLGEVPQGFRGGPGDEGRLDVIRVDGMEARAVFPFIGERLAAGIKLAGHLEPPLARIVRTLEDERIFITQVLEGHLAGLVDREGVEFSPSLEDLGIAFAFSRMLDEGFDDVAGAIGSERVFEKDAARVAMLRGVGFSAAVRIRPLRPLLRVGMFILFADFLHERVGAVGAPEGGAVDISIHFEGSPGAGLLLTPRAPSTAAEGAEKVTVKS